MADYFKGSPLFYNPDQSSYIGDEQRNSSFFPFDSSNVSTTEIATTQTEAPINPKPCQRLLYIEIPNSMVRIWDLIILIPNVLFLLFLIIKFPQAVRKLRITNSPMFTAFQFLVSMVAIISVLRCIVSMTVNATLTAGDIADKSLWLILRFFLLATELSVVIFGLAFGNLDSRTSIGRVLCLTFFISLVYSTTQGVLEFKYPDDRFHVKHDDEEFDIFGHGGMAFWFATSVFFFVIYTIICILPLTSLKQRFALPTKKAFYLYCGCLAVLNLIQAVGSGLLHYYIQPGLCIVNGTTYIYFTCFAPLVYITFLREFFRASLSPPNILFSYKSQVDDPEDDQVYLPHQTYIPTKVPSPQGGAEYHDPMSTSYDSTHFESNPTSPNPLYDVDMPFTGTNAELSMNSDYFGRATPSFGDKEMQSPVA